MKKLIAYVLLALFAAILGHTAFKWLETHNSKPQQNHGLPGGNFTLQGPNGPVSLSDFKGQPVLIYFGYTYCPDVCPTSLFIMAKAMTKLESDGIKVKGIFISVDHERDTPETLKTYAPYFHPNIIGLTSDKHRILEVTTRYGSYYKKVESEQIKDYLIDHTSRIYVIDTQGELVALVSHGATSEEVVNEVLSIL